MKQRNKTFRRLAAALLAAAVLLPGSALPSAAAAYAAESAGVVGEARDLMAGKKGPYDLLIHFHSTGNDVDLKEQADMTQQEARSILQQAGDQVESWESFYITNAIHAKIKSKDLVYRLARLPQVKQITLNGKLDPVEPIDENDESDRMQFFSNNIYQPDNRDIEWGVLQVQADKVWDEFKIDGTGVTVGVIDGAANYSLPALKHAFKPNGYKDFVDHFETPTKTPSDDHGTHVAGTIVGREDSGRNRIGVAPGAQFVSARAMGAEGGEQADLIAAAEWMLEQQPAVVNNSWGGPGDNSDWFQNIISAWVNAGIIPVFAAGNTAEQVPGEGTIANPANYKDVIAVAAVDRDKKIGRFSNKGPSSIPGVGQKPEISAPGVQVRSVDSNGNYVSWNGTSMAAPHVTGVIALIRQAAIKANRSTEFDELEEIRQLLIDTAEPLSDQDYPGSPNNAYGYGLVNAYDAVAKIMKRDSVELTGQVLQNGTDAENPTVAFQMEKESYLGRDLQVKVQVTDDVSIREASLTYTVPGKQAKTEKMTLVSGVQNNGIYAFTIPSSELAAGELTLSVSVTDFGNHVVAADDKITIRSGMKLPWKQNFEQAGEGRIPAGFLMDGSWAISGKVGDKEPTPPGSGNTTYVGINAGHNGFERRVDSYLYLPPIDLSDVLAADHPSLTVDMFNSFTGITTADVQISTQGGKEGSWELLHHVTLRPDITARAWENHTFPLDKYAGQPQPVQIRFYFYGHDSDDDTGMGWYLDNMIVQKKETTPPEKVKFLKSSVDEKGLKIIFDANEESDLVGYKLERKGAQDADFKEIADIKQDLKKFRFVNANEEKERPESHYHVEYFDDKAADGQSYQYRVYAYDVAGNRSPASDVIDVTYQSYVPRVSYDFEKDNGNFRKVQIKGTVNDWEHGKPQRPAGELSFNEELTWDGLMMNKTNMWGTKLSKTPTRGQEYSLEMPSFTVEDGDHLYFDSCSSINYFAQTITFQVDIQKEGDTVWYPLVSRETIMSSPKLHDWQKIECSLQDYVGKKVTVRFYANVGTPSIGSDELGWYIDNVLVGKKQNQVKTAAAEAAQNSETMQAQGYYPVEPMAEKFEQQGIAKPAAEPAPAVSGIPFKAKVTVEESGRSVESSEIDGGYSIKQTAYAKNTYTLKFEAYGYKTQTKTVTGTGKLTVPTVLMVPAQKAAFGGSVTAADGSKLSGVSVRLVGDENMPLMETNSEGAYSCENSYEGKYTLRFFKAGYEPRELTVDLVAGKKNDIPVVALTPVSAAMKQETVDYGYKPTASSNGSYLTIQFTSGPKGAAVRFQAPHEKSVLKSADIFFVKNENYSGEHVQVGVLSFNDSGRLVELSPFRDYKVAKPNDWNTVEFSEHVVKTNKPIYIAVAYDEDHTNFSQCMGVFYDVNASEKAKERSFIYDGAFTNTLGVNPPGAYAMKCSWYYPEGAASNPESTEGEGGSGGQPPIIDDESAFEFDVPTNTITKYLGSKTEVVIPDKINNVPVKRIGNEAFAGNQKPRDQKLTSIVIPEGVEEIGDYAFRNNCIGSIKLPSTLKKIGMGAFQYQFGGGGMDLEIPAGVTVIEKSVFENTASPLKVTMPGVTTVKSGAFAGNKQMEIRADKLKTIEDKAFGFSTASDFPYAKVFTKNTALKSVNNQYLINPTEVVVKHLNARDSEDLTLGQAVFCGENITGWGRDQAADKFYQIGETVTIKPHDFRVEGKRYSSNDQPITLKLTDKNEVSFNYTMVDPQIRTPILTTDTEVVGFGLPNAKIKLTIGGKVYNGVSNEDGYFSIPIENPKKNSAVAIEVNGKPAGEETVIEKPAGDYIFDGDVLVRYIGEGGNVIIPVSSSDGGAIKKIAPFAFKGAKLDKVTLPNSLEQICVGAFMETGLKSFGWALADFDKNANLRLIDEYAFRGNELTSVILPELVHNIQTGAFENNKIAELQLGRYTGHVGKRAFKNNLLKRVALAPTAEEVGEEAFMNNQIEELIVYDRLEGYEDGLESIPANAFANNKMTEAKFPITVTEIDENAFHGNTDGRFIVVSDAKEIVPTAGYDVRRSDGTLLKWKDTVNPTPGGGGGGGGLPVAPDKGGEVVIDGKTEHGSAEITPKNPKPGEKVTVTVKPDDGYKADNVIVKDKNGNKLPVSIIGKGTFTFEMPEGKVTVTPVIGKKIAAETSFTDVEKGSWYEEAVQWASENGVASGTSENSFSPDAGCTRSQMVTFLWRAVGQPKAENRRMAFKDVSADAYYREAVLWAVENGVTAGITADSFAPDAVCTRAQTVSFLHRLAGKEAAQATGSFTDVSRNAYYREAVLWALGRGITAGTSSSTFGPDDTCTRAQIVTFLYRYLGK